MAFLPPGVIDAVSMDADNWRRVFEFFARGNQGVRLEADLKVSAPGAMNVAVAAGEALILGTENAITQGAYHVANDASVTLAISAADATNPRNDLVVVEVRDAAYSGANKDARAVVVTGTPAASPADPSLSGHPNSITVARVVVPALAASVTSGMITDLRPRYGNPYHAEVYLAAGQNVLNNTTTQIAYDTVEADPNSNFTTGASAHYTCPVDGRYRVTATVLWNNAGIAADRLQATVYKNGSEYKRGTQAAVPASNTNPSQQVVATVRAVATDTISIRTLQLFGGTTGLLAGAAYNWAQFEWLGPL